MRHLYVCKLIEVSQLPQIEPALVKIWNAAAKKKGVRSESLKNVPLQTLDCESFFNLLGTMQLELLLAIEALTLSIIDEADRYGLRVTERRKTYTFQDFKNETVKMFGAGIVLMPDFEIENALK